MTKVTVFGEQKEQCKKKPIELTHYVNSSSLDINDYLGHNLTEVDEVTLLGKAISGKDWIRVEQEGEVYIYLGHWNDGVVE